MAGGGPREWQFTHQAMACTWGVTLVHERGAYAEQAANTAFEEIDRLERLLSRFVPGSDIWRINALQAGERVRVGPDAFECLRLAQRIHALTFGAFDVTVGALVNDRTDRPDWVAGMHLLQIDEAARTVGIAGAARKQGSQSNGTQDGVPGSPLPYGRGTAEAGDSKEGAVRVDLGGIGKGYAIDRMVELLHEWGVAAALLHCGQSTTYALGAPGDAEGWEVGLRDPGAPERVLEARRLRDRAMSGSGALLHGRHIIDPRRGRPAEGPIAAWAEAPSAAVADALSTALMVMSADEASACFASLPECAGTALTDEKGNLLHFGAGGK